MQVNYDDTYTSSADSEIYKFDEKEIENNTDDHRLDELKKKAADYVDLSRDKKISFSKIMLIIGLSISLLMCIACVVLRIIYQQDISDIMTITIATFFTDSTYGGFYYWKEKNANRAKYAQQFVLLFADEYGVDAAIRIAEIVLKD